LFPKDAGFEEKVDVCPLTLCEPPVFVQTTVSPASMVSDEGEKEKSDTVMLWVVCAVSMDVLMTINKSNGTFLICFPNVKFVFMCILF
jgi:hypothetical protein